MYGLGVEGYPIFIYVTRVPYHHCIFHLGSPFFYFPLFCVCSI